MKYYLIAGERSGDLHASNVMKALKLRDKKASFRFFGGEYMQAVGGELVVHYKHLAVMGVIEVLSKIFTIYRYIILCKKDILQWKPKVIILVDYGGFNLKIAKYAKSKGIKVVYYISPKIWAWNQGRAYTLKKRIDKMLTILPFEVDFYKKFDWEVDYVGNPVVEAVKKHKINYNFLLDNNLKKEEIKIAILPGSRKQEVKIILPILVSVVLQFPNHQFIVAGVNNLPDELYKPISKYTNVTLIFEQTYDLLVVANAAIVCSGTASLETALFNIPQVVIYKTSFISYHIAKRVVSVNYMSLVNLIVNKELVPELLQSKCNPEKIASILRTLLKTGTNYTILNQLIGTKVASEEVAKNIIKAYRE